MKATGALLAIALTLGGCATTGSVSPTQISDTAKQVQGYTRTICAFVPTIQTIVGIINAGAASAIGVASDICAAVTTAPLADGGPRQAKVNGVVIHGRFVR